jgi:hypothetical protein
MAGFARQPAFHRCHQIGIADQHLAGTLLDCLFEQRLARRVHTEAPSIRKPFGGA